MEKKKNIKNYVKLNNNQLQNMFNVMENFRFDDVRKMMLSINWTWVFYDECFDNEQEFRTPELYELKEFLRNMIFDVYERKNNTGDLISLSSGGFTVKAFEDDSLDISFGLSYDTIY